MSDNKSNKKVLIAMSGGVDSTVAAFLLKKQGYDCIGIGMTVFPQEFKDKYGKDFDSRCYINDLKDVKAICDHLNIPFYAINGIKEYETMVLDRIIASRLSGTNCPSCVFCNNMKFMVLFDRANKLKANYVATGHYAKIHKNIESGKYQLYSSSDKSSDQSHLLSDLHEDELAHIIFPLSELRKVDVIKMAKKFNLPYKEKPEIHDSCLIKSQSIIGLVEDKTHESIRVEGYYYNARTNYQISDAEGIYKHYIGQQEVDVPSHNHLYDKNSVVIELDSLTGKISLAPKDWLEKSECKLNNVTLSTDTDYSKPISIVAKYSEGDPIKATLIPKNNSCAVLKFVSPATSLNVGDFITFYNKEGKTAKIIGSGIVEIVDEFYIEKRISDDSKIEEDEEGNIIKRPDKEVKF